MSHRYIYNIKWNRLEMPATLFLILHYVITKSEYDLEKFNNVCNDNGKIKYFQ